MNRLGLLLFAVATAACLPQVGPPLDGGAGGGGGITGEGGGGNTGVGGGVADVGCPGFAGCVAFTDLSDASALREVRFGRGADTYEPKCVRIRVGQALTFRGNFDSHPLDPACGAASAITSTSGGQLASFTFNTPGTFGYYCSAHGSSTGSGMAGAVEVVP